MTTETVDSENETELSELVASDPQLSAAEKESAFSMLGNEKEFTAMSAKKTVVRSLVKHDHFDLDWAVGKRGEERERVESREAAREFDELYVVSGTMPIGCLTVKSKPRSKNHQSHIVNAETIDPDAFNDTNE